jgi:predicted phosphodiesterase
MIYVTGDCHGNFARFEQKHFSEQANMTKDDAVIIAGDFGGVWFGDSRDDETLDWLERLPFTLAFVCGNHENYDALERYPVAEWHGGKVHRVRPHVLHLMRGQIFELEGCRFFTMGGAKSHDTNHRINHISWWRQELPSDEEYSEALQNLERYNWQVDYIITHCAPTSIALAGSRHNEADRLTDFLQEVRERATYHYWLFGHYHDNRAIDEKHILLWEQIVRVI